MLVSHTSLSRKLKTSLPWVGLPIVFWASEDDATDSGFHRFCVREYSDAGDVIGQERWNSGDGKKIPMVPKQNSIR